MSITTRPIEVTADAKSKVYGTTDPALTYQITSGSLVGSDAFSGSVTRVAGENVGTYAINQGSLGINANYAVSFVSNDLSITTRPIEITADVKSKVYGTTDPVLTYQITSGSLVGSDAFSGNATRVAGENVGTYAINQGSLGINANYAISFVSNNLSITKRAIEVTAEAKSKVYGNSDPALTYTITNGSLIGSDIFTGTLSRVEGQAQGNYAIQQGTLSLGSNYDLTFVSANFYIDYRFIRVIPTAPLQKTYGDPDPALIWPYTITEGSLAYDDTLETYGTFRANGENVGRYQIRGLSARFTSNNGGESSYAITYTNSGSVSLDIIARAIEVTADAKSKVYGDPEPTLTYTITSGNLVGSDAFTGSLDRAVGEDVGTYAINQGTLNNSNYAISFISNDVTITARNITVAADAKTKVYGSGDSVLSYRVTNGGLVLGDTFSGSLTRVVGENVGIYAINQGSLSLSPNYNITYIGNDLTITRRAITITADAKTKVFGTTDPALTYQITSGSLVGSDFFVGDLTRAPGETVGNYIITQGTLALNINYTVTFINSIFSITASANQSIWTGNTSSVWNVSTNWSGDVTPPTNHDVLIPNVTTAPEIASGIVAEMNSLEVKSSASLQILQDGAAVIENNFDNNGTITITSTSANSGTLIVKGTANGEVTYERGGLLANQWSIVTAPVSGQSIKDFVDNIANNIRRNTTVTPNRVAVGYYDDSQPTGSKWVYYTTDDLASNSVTFEKGRSYIISRATDGVVTFTGTLETTNVTKSVTASEWNAIGNPYTAYIPVNENGGDNFIQDNLASFDPTYMGIYVWDTTQNKYVANSLVTGAKSVAPGQGFFVRTTTGVTNMNFKESLRSIQNVGGTFHRGAAPISSIKLIMNTTDSSVNTIITFREEASLGLDPGYDLGNFNGANFDVFTRLVASDRKENFTYQSLPEEAIETQIIPVGVTSKEGTELVFTAAYINLPEGIEVYLEDRLENTFVQLDVTKGASYTVQLDEKVNGIGRFYLHTKSSTLTTPTLNINDVKVYNRNLELIVEGIQEKSFEVNLYNTIGEKVFEGTHQGTGRNVIDLPEMEVGIYIARITTAFGTKDKKIIIKK
ncbi:Hemagglutination activity domain-containing protein (modular protein) [Tenacibaculum amylolyticum]